MTHCLSLSLFYPAISLSLSLSHLLSLSCQLSQPMTGSDMETSHFLLLDKTGADLQSWTLAGLGHLLSAGVSAACAGGTSRCSGSSGGCSGRNPRGCRRRCPAPLSFVSSVVRQSLELPNLEKPQCSSHKNHVYGRGGAYSVILHDGLSLPRRSPSAPPPQPLPSTPASPSSSLLQKKKDKKSCLSAHPGSRHVVNWTSLFTSSAAADWRRPPGGAEYCTDALLPLILHFSLQYFIHHGDKEVDWKFPHHSVYPAASEPGWRRRHGADVCPRRRRNPSRECQSSTVQR